MLTCLYGHTRQGGTASGILTMLKCQTKVGRGNQPQTGLACIHALTHSFGHLRKLLMNLHHSPHLSCANSAWYLEAQLADQQS